MVINTDEPLNWILRLDVLRDGKETTLLLWYEKLLDHCFRCGRLGYMVRDFSVEAEGDVIEDFNTLFGPRIKVVSPMKRHDYRQRKDEVRDGISWGESLKVDVGLPIGSRDGPSHLVTGENEMRGSILGTMGAARQAVATVVGTSKAKLYENKISGVYPEKRGGIHETILKSRITRNLGSVLELKIWCNQIQI